MSKINIELMSEDRISEHLELASLVYETPQVIEKIHFVWKHCVSPCGNSLCVALRNDEAKLVGRMLLQPRKFWVDRDKSLSGATITDLVIDPKHRSAAHFIGMVKAAKSPAGMALVIHTSNEVSEPLYRQLFKFKSAVELLALGLPVSIFRFLKPYIANSYLRRGLDILTIAPIRLCFRAWAGILTLFTKVRLGERPSDKELDVILKEFKSAAGPHFERTSDFIKWRISDSPLFPIHIEWLWQGKECLGYMAWQRIEKRELQIFVIIDLVTRRQLNTSQLRAMKLLAISLCIEHEMDAVFTLINVKNPLLEGLASFPFLRIPESQLPHPSPIYFHADDKDFPLDQRGATYLSLADLDFF
jgi:hypothetical protein